MSCSTCSGTKRLTVVTPGGKRVDAACPRCAPPIEVVDATTDDRVTELKRRVRELKREVVEAHEQMNAAFNERCTDEIARAVTAVNKLEAAEVELHKLVCPNCREGGDPSTHKH